MLDQLLELLQTNQVDLTNRLIPMLITLLVSFAVGLLIYFIYTKSFRGVVYNHNFAVSLSLMTTLTTMITLAISSNIALSLGMVGALSIVRYRTAIKDPMDLIFLFWSVTVGITIGAAMYHLAFIGSLIAILTILAINRYSPSTRKYILLVHYTGGEIDEALRRILNRVRYQVKSRTMRANDTEMALELLIRNNNLTFMDAIKELPNVSDLSLVQYSSEFHG